MVPARVRRRIPLGASRHRGHRLHRERGPTPGEGADGDRGAVVHRVPAAPRRRLSRRGWGRIAAGVLGLAAIPLAAGAPVGTTARRTPPPPPPGYTPPPPLPPYLPPVPPAGP